MILKWFAMLEQVTGSPGLDLPALDVAAVAGAYGWAARQVSGREELTEALREDIASDDVRGWRRCPSPPACGSSRFE